MHFKNVRMFFKILPCPVKVEKFSHAVTQKEVVFVIIFRLVIFENKYISILQSTLPYTLLSTVEEHIVH